jgi:hypothetical protein
LCSLSSRLRIDAVRAGQQRRFAVGSLTPHSCCDTWAGALGGRHTPPPVLIAAEAPEWLEVRSSTALMFPIVPTCSSMGSGTRPARPAASATCSTSSGARLKTCTTPARGRFLSVFGMALSLVRNDDSFNSPTHFKLSDLLKKFDTTFGATKSAEKGKRRF